MLSEDEMRDVEEFRALLKILKLTPNRAALVVDQDPHRVRKWAKAKASVQPQALLYLRTLAAFDLDPDEVVEVVDAYDAVSVAASLPDVVVPLDEA